MSDHSEDVPFCFSVEDRCSICVNISLVMCLCVHSEQKLEETCEELQRVTEAERLLRTRCAYLEEKQRQKKDQIEVEPNDSILSFPHI